MTRLLALAVAAGCSAPAAPVAAVHPHRTASPAATPTTAPRPHPTVASRSRTRPAGKGIGHDWTALAACESGGDPRAVSASGRYRGAFQMDADFWRTYGGLRFAARPDLATYAQQLVVAQRGYDARGASPWPVCGRKM